LSSSTTEHKEVGKAHRCAHCGGALKFGADDIVCTCPYCGYTSEIDGEPIEDHYYYPSVSEETVKKRVMEFIARSNVKNVDITEVKVVYIPFWRFQVSAVTKYKGYIVDKGSKDQKYRLYLPVESSSSYSGGVFILARRFAAFYGLDKLKTQLRQPLLTERLFNFEEIKSEAKAFLNAEISAEEARAITKSAIEDEQRHEAEKVATDIVDCATETRLGQISYWHVPLYMVRYSYRGKLFKIALDGRDGTLLLGELPTTLVGSLSNLVLSFSYVIASAILGGIGPPLFLILLGTEPSEGGEYIFVVFGFCLLLAFVLLTLALSSLRKFFSVQLEYRR